MTPIEIEDSDVEMGDGERVRSDDIESNDLESVVMMMMMIMMAPMMIMSYVIALARQSQFKVSQFLRKAGQETCRRCTVNGTVVEGQ